MIPLLKSRFALAAALLLAAGATAEAQNAKGALGALALSPDGQTLAAAGDNQALYLLDPATLAVRARHHLGSNPLELWYSADGGTLAVWVVGKEVHLLSTEDWSLKASFSGIESVAHAAAADALVLLGRSTLHSGNRRVTPLQLVALADGTPGLQAELEAGAFAVATPPDAGGFVILTVQVKNEAEPKQSAPKDLSGAEKLAFEQQNDGNAAEILLLDAAGQEVGRQPSWFSLTSALTGLHGGERVWFVGYANQNLSLAADGGDLAVFQLPGKNNHAVAVSPGQDRYAVSSKNEGAIFTPATEAMVAFKVEGADDKEQIRGFAFAPDGSVYAGTSYYRVVHIGADGAILASQPVF